MGLIAYVNLCVFNLSRVFIFFSFLLSVSEFSVSLGFIFQNRFGVKSLRFHILLSLLLNYVIHWLRSLLLFVVCIHQKEVVSLQRATIKILEERESLCSTGLFTAKPRSGTTSTYTTNQPTLHPEKKDGLFGKISFWQRSKFCFCCFSFTLLCLITVFTFQLSPTTFEKVFKCLFDYLDRLLWWCCRGTSLYVYW